MEIELFLFQFGRMISSWHFAFLSKDLFNRSDGSYSSLSNSLWEARVIAIISCIKEKEVTTIYDM